MYYTAPSSWNVLVCCIFKEAVWPCSQLPGLWPATSCLRRLPRELCGGQCWQVNTVFSRCLYEPRCWACLDHFKDKKRHRQTQQKWWDPKPRSKCWSCRPGFSWSYRKRLPSLSLLSKAQVPFSQLTNFYSFYEPQFRSLFLWSFLDHSPIREKWVAPSFVILFVFLFDHFTRSYWGNLFLWPSSQTPKVDSVLFFFLFPAPGQVPGTRRCLV